MNLIRIDRQRALSYVERPTPAVQAGEILVEPLHVGVCGTDLQMINGERECETDVLGHEGSARVVLGNRDFPADSYVTFSPLAFASQDQVLGHSTPGLLQQRRVVTAAELQAGLLVALPAGFDLALAPLAEPLAATVYSWQLLRPFLREGRILVIGDGTIGQLAAAYFARQGAQVSLVTSRSGQRLPAAATGPVRIIAAADFYAAKPSGTAGVDAVLLAVPRSGAAQALDRAMPLVRPEGCIDLIGGLPDGSVHGMPLETLAAVRRANVCGIPASGKYLRVAISGGRELHVCGHRGVSQEQMALAIEELQAHPARYRPVLTHRIALSSAAPLLAALAGGARTLQGSRCTKLVVDMRGDA